MAFPTSPTNGQTYTQNNITYVYNSTNGVWDIQGVASVVSGVTSVAGRSGVVTLTAADIGSGTFPGAVTAGTTLAVTGATTLAGASATSLSVSGTTTLGTVNAGAVTASSLSVSGTLNVGGLTGVTALNGVTIGATTPSTGAFTSLSATGVSTIPNHFINRSGVTASGINWYSTGYTSWSEYMASAGTTSCGPSGLVTAPSGTLVTSWALRSFIENASGYGWTWESGTSNQVGPSVVAEIRSSDGAFRSASHVTAAGSLGVGTAASGTTGEGRFTNQIVAYYSDERLKTKISTIENALDKIDELTGFLYVENELARSLGFNNPNVQTALSAQAVKRVQPEVVKPAPFDIAQREDGTEYSKSGENYLTVDYEKLIPLLVEGIKELRREINQLKGK